MALVLSGRNRFGSVGRICWSDGAVAGPATASYRARREPISALFYLSFFRSRNEPNISVRRMGTFMKIADVRKNAYSMPLTNPSYPPGPYRFYSREYMIIAYRTDPDALRAV